MARDAITELIAKDKRARTSRPAHAAKWSRGQKLRVIIIAALLAWVLVLLPFFLLA